MSSKKNSNKNQNKNQNKNSNKIVQKKKRKYQTITTQLFNSDENLSSLHQSGGTYTTVLVKNSSTQGVRKAKNFTLQISTKYNIEQPPYTQDQKYGTGPISFALVYCPCNQNSLTLQSPTTQQNLLYPIPKNVILSGFILDGTVTVFKSDLARNLSAGDSIQISLYNSTGFAISDVNIAFSLNYAIAFN
ncbi:hypothetical protein M9Y10_009379 [Tritrichomonas musculus]|uniref:Uncharacterized protein n=1 Tax=Tritrichomonas musculus TaxID=1915356 RepID=A0ABR2IN70_9EUKA